LVASFRFLVLAVLIGGLGLALGACSPRPTSSVLTPVPHAPAYTVKVRILVATTRGYGSTEDPKAFTVERSDSLNYAAVTVSIPKAHVPGQIEWPDQLPADPSRHFVTTARERLAAPQFVEQIRQQVRAAKTVGQGENSGQVLVFVHGYNTRYEEAVYWLAQFVHDANYQGTVVLFSWPSMGKARLYLADRESSTFSRDYLEQTLRQLAALKEVKEVDILAHSMGTWLTVETLRQAKLKGDGQFGGKLGDVILAAPDLDVNVFRTQLDVIGRLRRPMTVVVSGDDKVLGLSTQLSGGIYRAGMVNTGDPRIQAAIKRYNLRVIDITAVNDGDGNHHSKFSRSSAVMAALGRTLSAKHDHGPQAPQPGVVTALTDVGESLVRLPTTILGLPGVE
jgi:esterase/lipase superfamily enzyme